MADTTFFDISAEQSEVKSRIASKYFFAWARVITSSQIGDRIAYIDLYAGPGRYRDGTLSTPLLILRGALDNALLRKRLVTLFNDGDSDHSRSLAAAIDGLPGIKTLKHKPIVEQSEVGDEIVERFESIKLVPAFFFVDPWGYKGLSVRLINSVLKDWGCDCLFFFNYNRINMGLGNPAVAHHVNALFGESRAAQLRLAVESLRPVDRERRIMHEIAEAMRERAQYVLPFRFLDHVGTRTSHYLVFVSKNLLGYKIMKEVMAKESEPSTEGVPSFEFSPARTLFSPAPSIESLKRSMLGAFAGKTLTMKAIFDAHNVGTQFISRNYKRALSELEKEGKIKATPSDRSRGFADHVVVKFPKG